MAQVSHFDALLPSLCIFPLVPIVDGRCGCGKDCDAPGKHPAYKWGALKAGEKVRGKPGQGHGIVTGARSGVFVVESDSDDAEAWFVSRGLPETLTVRSGSGRGNHRYFKWPGFKVWSSGGGLYPALDIKGDGGFVCAPESLSKSGGVYTITHDVPVADAPDWLLEWLQAQCEKRTTTVSTPPDTPPEGEQAAREQAASLRLAATPFEGKGDGSRQLQALAGLVVCGFGCGEGGGFRVLRAAPFADRNGNPWSDADIRRRCEDAFREQRIEWGCCYLTEEERQTLRDLTTKTTPVAPTTHAEPKTKKDRWTVVRSETWTSPPKPPKYLIDRLIVQGSVSMVYAEPGSIKSFTTLDMARCITQGIAWMGLPVNKGPVLWVDFEDAELEFRRRLWLLNKGNKCPNILYLYQPCELNTPKGVPEAHWAKLTQIAKENACVATFFDTLGSSQAGIEENATTAAAGLKRSGQFTEDVGCSAIWTHHANAKGGVRGTTAFKADVDLVLHLDRVDSDDTSVHRATLTCQKSGQKRPHTICLELTDKGLKEIQEKEMAAPKEKTRTAAEWMSAIQLVMCPDPQTTMKLSRTEIYVRLPGSSINAKVAAVNFAIEKKWLVDAVTGRAPGPRGDLQWVAPKVSFPDCFPPEFFLPEKRKTSEKLRSK